MTSKVTDSTGDIVPWRKKEKDDNPNKIVRHCGDDKTVMSILDHVLHARNKHPWPESMSHKDAYLIVERELHEVAVAMLKGDSRGIKKESLDCIAVLFRIVEGDYYRGSCEKTLPTSG